MNLAPYENYVLTNDIIEGGARARYVRGRRAGRAYLLSRRKNESGEHEGNRLGACMGNRSGEHAVAWESRRNDWTDNHAKARAGKWLKRE